MTQSLAIRFAMLTGVLLFGAVTFFARKSGTASAGEVPADSMLLMARVLWAVAIGGCVVLFFALRRNPSPARVGSLSTIAWALGEGVALYGAVVWYLSGNSAWYAPGVVFLVLTFLAFPGRRS